MQPPQKMPSRAETVLIILSHLGRYLVVVATGVACFVAYSLGAGALFFWLAPNGPSHELVGAQILWLVLWLLLLQFSWSFAGMGRHRRVQAMCALCVYAVLSLVVVVHWYRESLIRDFTRRLPIGLQTSEVLHIGEDDYCGAAVFRMPESVRLHLRTRGVQAVAPGWDLRWRDTPVEQPSIALGHPSQQEWRHGLHSLCTGLLPGTRQAILAALDRSGSYYAIQGDATILVLPELGWVVYSFHGD